MGRDRRQDRSRLRECARVVTSAGHSHHAADVGASGRLRIGIDGTELGALPTGVGTYLTALLSRWTQQPDLELVLFVRQADHVPDSVARADNLEVVAGSSLLASKAVAWQQLMLPRLVKRAGVDVLFGPAYSLPVSAPFVARLLGDLDSSGPATVVALHDLSFERYPESFPTREGIRRRWLGRESANRATRVLTISKSSAAEIESLYLVPSERITVTALGVDPDFADLEDLPDATELLEKLDVSRPLILSVGTLFNRRHPMAMVRAFETVQQTHPDATLVIVGENRTIPRVDLEAAVRNAGLDQNVLLLDHTPREHLRELYKLAEVFLYLSDYEGFGLPPLEAMAGGTPTIVLDRSASGEYWAPHALALDSPDPERVAQAILDVLESPSLGLRDHERLAQVYDWDETAARTLDALRSAADEPRHRGSDS